MFEIELALGIVSTGAKSLTWAGTKYALPVYHARVFVAVPRQKDGQKTWRATSKVGVLHWSKQACRGEDVARILGLPLLPIRHGSPVLPDV